MLHRSMDDANVEAQMASLAEPNLPARAPSVSPVKLSIEDVSMTFSGVGKTVPVLEHVSLDVHAGELVCLLGPSGCGKSTLLNIVGGFLRATSGGVRIDGA